MEGRNLKAFIGAMDYACSRDFYIAIGFSVNWDQGQLAEMELNGCRFLLQDYYNQEWCNNTMLHMEVPDARAWHARVTEVLDQRSYGAARTRAPTEESYGALVTYVWDPSGVLWHMAETLS